MKSYRLLKLPLDFWLRVFGDFLTGFGRSMLIPFMLIYLKQESGYPTWIVTLLTAVPQAFQLFSTSWGGVLADYYGRKPIMFISLFSSGIILSLMLSHNYVLVYIGYVAFLIISNFYRPAAMAVITEVVEPERHRDAFSVLRMAANVGFALGPLVGGFLFFTHRTMAVTGTAAAYIITALSVFLMQETMKKERSQETALLKNQNPLGSFYLLKRDVLLRWAFFSGVLFLMAELQMFTSFTIVVNDYFRDNGRTLSFLLLVNTIGVVIGQYVITYYTRTASYFSLLSMAIFFSAAGWGMLLLPVGYIRFYMILLLVTVAEMLMTAGYNPYIASLAQSGEGARYMSFTQTSNIIGQMAGPTIGAVGYDLAGQNGYVMAIWLMLALAYLGLKRLKYKHSQVIEQG